MSFIEKTLQHEHTFTVSTQSGDMPFVVTRQALDEFEMQGLAAMDDVLIHLSDRHTPSNAPHKRPNPLDLLGYIILEGLNSGNMRKLMMCALWLGHHYPSINGVLLDECSFDFTYQRAEQSPNAALG